MKVSDIKKALIEQKKINLNDTAFSVVTSSYDFHKNSIKEACFMFSGCNSLKEIDFSKFEGYLDESLETIQLEKVYNRHKKQLGEFKEGFFFYPRSSKNGSPFSLALINVAFDYTIKNYSMVKRNSVSYLSKRGMNTMR